LSRWGGWFIFFLGAAAGGTLSFSGVTICTAAFLPFAGAEAAVAAAAIGVLRRQPKVQSQGQCGEMRVDVVSLSCLVHAVIVVFGCASQIQKSQAAAERTKLK
jgi:F0F1-type ATP synthase membrane subunit c/vacuolar-type H+-ATPase subunit K